MINFALLFYYLTLPSLSALVMVCIFVLIALVTAVLSIFILMMQYTEKSCFFPFNTKSHTCYHVYTG